MLRTHWEEHKYEVPDQWEIVLAFMWVDLDSRAGGVVEESKKRETRLIVQLSDEP
jgi:hypothetical protein